MHGPPGSHGSGGRGRRGRRGRRRGPHGPGRDFWHHHGPPGPPNPRAWREAFAEFLGEAPEEHWMFGGRRFRPWLMGEAGFNPFVAMALSKGGGLLPLYVLHLIAQEPRYGNALMTAIEERTGGAWGTNPGAIYPLLNDMEEHGLIEGDWEDPDRRTVRRYTITARGREELDRLKAVMRPRLQEALDVLSDVLDDLDSTSSEGDDAAGDADESRDPAAQPFQPDS